MKRRALLKAFSLASLWPSFAAGRSDEHMQITENSGQSKSHIAVAGAGIFGCWTALFLLRSGFRVTLIDPWGAGHSRASSGGEHRVIRHAYRQQRYVQMVARSYTLWNAFENATGRQLFHQSGLVFMSQQPQSDYLDAAYQHMKKIGVQAERLDTGALQGRYPELNSHDIGTAVYDPTGGYLMAREATQAVMNAFRDEGGAYIQSAARPGDLRNGRMSAIRLDGQQAAFDADHFVFACGPWLSNLFPDLLSSAVTVSRQTVFFFGGLDTQSNRLMRGEFPVWADLGDELWYGIAAKGNRGFKLANDTRGVTFDPSRSDRVVTPAEIDVARSYLARRFPSLADAPLLESRVCQYTNTADGDFIMGQHPEANNVWLLGAGNGHGFKHGPAMGELMSNVIQSKASVPDWLSLDRFSNTGNDTAA